jgi:hypothetical protein
VSAFPHRNAGLYSRLLSQRGPLLEEGVAGASVVLGGSGDGSTRNRLLLGLLRSLAALCNIVLSDELGPGVTGQVRALFVCAGASGVLCALHLVASTAALTHALLLLCLLPPFLHTA